MVNLIRISVYQNAYLILHQGVGAHRLLRVSSRSTDSIPVEAKLERNHKFVDGITPRYTIKPKIYQ
jgi:hypothetical protein